MKNNLQKRKKLRIPKYDYSSEGLYFLTICTKDRKCILSEIKQDDKSHKIELLTCGKITEKYIESINNIYTDVKIDNYIIMPNHVHFICCVCGSSRTPTPTNQRIPALISTMKRLINKESNEKVWQRNYYEHIIRNEKEYLAILEYIENNPYNWEKDKYYEEHLE